MPCNFFGAPLRTISLKSEQLLWVVVDIITSIFYARFFQASSFELHKRLFQTTKATIACPAAMFAKSHGVDLRDDFKARHFRNKRRHRRLLIPSRNTKFESRYKCSQWLQSMDERSVLKSEQKRILEVSSSDEMILWILMISNHLL